MSLRELQNRLDLAGAKLSVLDGKLSVRMPSDSLTPEIKSALREHRDVLIVEVQSRQVRFEARMEVAAEGERRRRLGLALPLCWLPRDVREERAAIQEFDGGLTRGAAEEAAGLSNGGTDG